MKISMQSRAQILSEALPYIQKYQGQTVVVKYGGAAMVDPELQRTVLSDIALLSMASVRMVIVHGGGPEINHWLGKMNIEPKFIDGLRYTDGETMDVVQMALAGKVGKDLVALIGKIGGKAISICGLDGGLMQATQKDPKYGQVGNLEAVDPTLIENLLDDGYIPVISPIAGGDDGLAYNINADTAAGQIATALKAKRLIILSDVPGILKDKDDESTLISKMNVSEIPRLVASGIIAGGMIPKLACCEEAVRRGVAAAHMIDGRLPHSLLIEMLTDGGIGTMITGG